tara:strand:+ start:627 stop:782 length:156 start_codon:yes stop_codon:yes gene_type:complete
MWNLNIKLPFEKLAEWEKPLIKKFKDKFNLSEYQLLWISFGKGLLIGAILL